MNLTVPWPSPFARILLAIALLAPAGTWGVEAGEGGSALQGPSQEVTFRILLSKGKCQLAAGKYFFFVEVNKSFDKNEACRYSWYRGQPSVVWRGTLQVGDGVSRGAAEIIGHGDPAGADGVIDADLSGLTTALGLVREVEAVFQP